MFTVDLFHPCFPLLDVSPLKAGSIFILVYIYLDYFCILNIQQMFANNLVDEIVNILFFKKSLRGDSTVCSTSPFLPFCSLSPRLTFNTFQNVDIPIVRKRHWYDIIITAPVNWLNVHQPCDVQRKDTQNCNLTFCFKNNHPSSLAPCLWKGRLILQQSK